MSKFINFLEPRMTPEQAQTIARTAAALSDDTSMVDAAHEPEWKAQPWIVQAIADAHELGRQNGQATTEAEFRLLSEAIESKYIEREVLVIRSTCAALIEAIYDDMPIGSKPEHPFVIVSTDKQATIWDRWTMTHKLQDDGNHVVMTLERTQ